MTAMNIDADTDRHCIDLTQLSSREQLSALMDGALPEDQTRFLLRRLQHDAELAGSWERWRIASDVMRGLAPARHLPSDFAARVSAAVQGAAQPQAPRSVAAAAAPSRRWWRGAGIGVVAAALAAVVLVARPTLAPERLPAAPSRLAAALPAAQSPKPLPKPSPSVPAPQTAAPDLLAAAAVAVAGKPKPVRRSKTPSTAAAGMASPAEATRIAAVMPPATAMQPRVAARSASPSTESPSIESPVIESPSIGIAPRPWPRSTLSRYGSGGGLTVGFGERLSQTADNPFTPPAFRAPPRLSSEPAPDTAAPSDSLPAFRPEP